MKKVWKHLLAVLLVLVIAAGSSVPVAAAAKITTKDYKKVLSSKGYLEYQCESKDYAVFLEGTEKSSGSDQVIYKLHYTKDMKKFSSVNLNEKLGVNFVGGVYWIDSVQYINNRFYIFCGGNSKYGKDENWASNRKVYYYETKDFKTFTKRSITLEKGVSYAEACDMSVVKSGSYYYLMVNKWAFNMTSIDYYSIYRSKDMKNWTQITMPSSFTKKISASKGYICNISVYGDELNIGKKGNAVLFTFKSYDDTEELVYKTTDFKKFTKVSSHKEDRYGISTRSTYIKMADQDKGICILDQYNYDSNKSTLTVSSGSGLKTSGYKTIQTIKNVETYCWTYASESSKTGYLSLIVKTTKGETYLYNSNAAATSLKKTKTKLDPNNCLIFGDIFDKYYGFSSKKKLYLTTGKNKFASYKTITTPISSPSKFGEFKGVTYVMDNQKVYTISKAKVDKAMK